MSQEEPGEAQIGKDELIDIIERQSQEFEVAKLAAKAARLEAEKLRREQTSLVEREAELTAREEKL